MSIDTIQADLKANLASLGELNALSSVEDIVKHLKNTLWPFQESLIEQLEDLDGCVEDMLNHAEDILQPKTGAEFLAVVLGGLVLASELKKRLGPGDDPKIMAGIAEFEANANAMVETLQEITIPEDEEDPDADDDDEDDEGDDDDDRR